jgi:hypothetical protein
VACAVLGTVLGIATTSRADPCALSSSEPCPVELPRNPVSHFPLARAWGIELPIRASLVLDWNGRVDRPEAAGRSRPSFQLAPEVVLPLVRDRQLRVGVIPIGVQLGRWGDDRHGDVSLLWGGRARWSFLMEDVLDLYVVVGADFALSLGTMSGSTPQIGARPVGGFGFRAARMLSFELNWYPLIPITTTFHDTENPTFEPRAFAVTLGVDPCLFMSCNAIAGTDQKPVRRDLRCRLYSAASDVCTTNAEIAQRVCAEVPNALGALPDHTTRDDGTVAFLAELARRLQSDAPAAKAASALVARHGELLRNIEAFQDRDRTAARHGTKLAEHWMYAPVPMELRHFLGCSEQPDTPTTKVVCPHVSEECQELIEAD